MMTCIVIKPINFT